MLTEAVVIAVAKSVEAIMTFLVSPEGQAACRRWREGDEQLRADLRTFWMQLTGSK